MHASSYLYHNLIIFLLSASATVFWSAIYKLALLVWWLTSSPGSLPLTERPSAIVMGYVKHRDEAS